MSTIGVLMVVAVLGAEGGDQGIPDARRKRYCVADVGPGWWRVDPVDRLGSARRPHPVRGLRRGRILSLGRCGAKLSDPQRRAARLLHRVDRRSSRRPPHPIVGHRERHPSLDRRRPVVAMDPRGFSPRTAARVLFAHWLLVLRSSSAERCLCGHRPATVGQGRRGSHLSQHRHGADVATNCRGATAGPHAGQPGGDPAAPKQDPSGRHRSRDLP